MNLCDGTLDKNARILYDDNDCVIYRIENEDGEITITEHSVFPGIWLTYKDAHTQSYRLPPNYPAGLLEVTHCREGRFEYVEGNQFFYLSDGDMAVGRTTDAAVVYCPTRHYHGVSVVIDPKTAPPCLSCFLDDVNVSPSALLETFCNSETHFIIRSTSQLEHIFSEIYSVPDRIKKGYIKIKILELMMFLSILDPDISQAEQHSCTKTQAELAKKICHYADMHPEIRLTIEQLAEMFFVSPAVVKKCFYSVYGESVYAYLRACKMKAAAQQLLTTDRTITDIADSFGYDNNSKFARAFRMVMGVSPTEYRKNVK